MSFLLNWGAENGGNSNIWKNMDLFLFSDCNNSLQVSQNIGSEVDKTVYIRKLYPEEGLNMGKLII